MFWWQYSLLFATVVLSALFASKVKKVNEQSLQWILAFSGAYLFSICVMHLLPEVMWEHSHDIGIYVLLGFVLQLLLDFISKGVEHGHVHELHGNKNNAAIGLMIGLSLHSLLEGIPLCAEFLESHSRTSLFYGILFHKIPAAIALSTILFISGFKPRTIWLMIVLFALMTPIGGLLGEQVGTNISNQVIPSDTLNIILALVTGSFLHISTTILFESGSSVHRFSVVKMIAIFAGILVAIFTSH